MWTYVLKMLNIESFTVFTGDQRYNYAHDPSIEFYLGEYWVVFQGGPNNAEGGPDQGILVCRSKDYAEWTSAEYLVEPTPGSCMFAPVLWVYREYLYLFYLENKFDPQRTESRINMGDLMLMKFDGKHWTSPCMVCPGLVAGGKRYAASCVNKPIVLDKDSKSPGRVVLPLQMLNDQDGYGQMYALYSDFGDQWMLSTPVPTPMKHALENCIVQIDGGCLLMYFRNWDPFPNGELWSSVSYDGGVTWSKPIITDGHNWAKSCVRMVSNLGYIWAFNDNRSPVSEHVCDLRRNLSVSCSRDAKTFTTSIQIDADSNGFGISYPDFIDNGQSLFVVSSRRVERGVRRPNMIRAHRVSFGVFQ